MYVVIFWLIPSIFLSYMIFLNICKQAKFSIVNVLVFAVPTWLIMSIFFGLGIAWIHIEVLRFAVGIGILLSIAILTYTITKDVYTSLYYATFARLLTITTDPTMYIPFYFIGIEVDWHLPWGGMSIGLYVGVLVSSILVCYVVSKFLGDKLHASYSLLSHDIALRFVKYGLVLSALLYSSRIVNLYIVFILSPFLLASINFFLAVFIFLISLFMMSNYLTTQHNELLMLNRINNTKHRERFTHELEAAYDQMRAFRHDHRNLLNMLIHYAQEDDIEGIKEHLANALDYSKIHFTEGMPEIVEPLTMIHVPELRTLLFAKLHEAKTQKIDVVLDINEPIYDVSVNVLDLCRMIGIVLDNAIEELAGHNKKILKFGVIRDEADVLFICTNPYEKIPNISKIFEQNYSTKGPNRGIGLSTIKYMCDKSKGKLAYTARTANEEFSIIITMLGLR